MPRDSESHSTPARPDGGWIEINPQFARPLARLGLNTADAIFELPGEVVSGHPDRHVLRVQLPGSSSAFYLKRQHSLKLRELVRNWRAGLGWVSRCIHEAKILRALGSLGLPGPRWVAFGQDSRGRPFLLVEEVANTCDLQQFLSLHDCQSPDRAGLARQLGETIARFHRAGFTIPELTAKHVLIQAGTRAIHLIDWQSSQQSRSVSRPQIIRNLASLHATLGDHLASPRERLRLLRAALGPRNRAREKVSQFRTIARAVVDEAARISERRSIRDQREGQSGTAQRLVWVADEAVCARPEIAAIWPRPAIAPPFYQSQPGTVFLRFPNGKEAVLIRGCGQVPFALARAWLRGRVWRAPGATLGRILFRLEHYSIAAPRLLAFGQRLTGVMSAEWFALYSPPAPPLTDEISWSLAAQLGETLRDLHEAGCGLVGAPLAAFGQEHGRVAIREPQAIRIGKPRAESDLTRLLRALPAAVRPAAWEAYQGRKRSPGSFRPATVSHRVINRLTRVGWTG